jgi:hypothetical protein
MILQPGPGESLSEILQWILGVFAQTWNRTHGLVGGGAVWAQRFFSRVIAGIRSYCHTFLYIDRNPVVAGLCDSEATWPWGRTGLLRRGPPSFFDDPPEDPWGLLR